MKKHLKKILVACCAVSLAVGISGCAATGTSAPVASTDAESAQQETGVTVNVAALKGPTGIGLAKMMDDTKNGSADEDYRFSIAGTPDEIVPQIVQGNVDIALLPANVASIVYAKTQGGISAIDVNTLGVLYVVTGDSSIKSFSDLAGHTVLMTGKGATPENTMDYLLAQNGLTDKVNLDYKSEATEVAAALAKDPTAIAVLPEPYVTAVCAKNSQLKSVVSLSDAWSAASGVENGSLVSGVTVVSTKFLEAHPSVVAAFLKEQAESVDYANEDPQAASQLVVDAGIVDDASIAAKAISRCNLVCLTNDDMKNALQGYLKVLYNADPSIVGGALPGDSFYSNVE